MTVTLGAISLPDDMVWKDELDWCPVSQIITPTLNGAAVVEETAASHSRPITLVGVTTRGVVRQLKQLEAELNPTMQLTVHGLQFQTTWRRPGVVATPFDEWADPEDGDPYNLTLNLMTVEA